MNNESVCTMDTITKNEMKCQVGRRLKVGKRYETDI